MHVIGTAGHVDHGKSTLIHALTGINPDRLREEQEREMTIDLGFAWLTLPGGEAVSVIDVPGHEDFIRNMLAGVGGIDAAVIVIAADEGVMPQTREHVAILTLLQVRHGLVALTKSDLVDDPEWLELVRGDIAELVQGTSLQGIRILPVSARTRQGLREFLLALEDVLKDTPTRRDLGRPRLAIDRVFTMTGFGTVVTGTLIDGRLRLGDEVEILPTARKARIRGLQTHKRQVETAFPGTRVAVNLTGVSTEDLARGQVITTPGWLTPTSLLDVQVHVLASAPRPLRHDQQIEFFTGASRANARVRVLGVREIAPGETGWCQLVLDVPLSVVKQDRFILRQPSPGETLGGGMIVDPHPARRHPRSRSEVIERLRMLAEGTPREILLEALRGHEPVAARVLARSGNLPRPSAEQALGELLADGSVILIGAPTDGGDTRDLLDSDRQLMTRATWVSLQDRVRDMVGEYHTRFPLRAGMPREEVKSRLKVDTKLFNSLTADSAHANRLVETEAILHLPEHKVTFTPDRQAQVDRLLKTFQANRFTPPSTTEAGAVVGLEVLNALLEQRVLVKLSDDVIFLATTYDEMVKRIVEYLHSQPTITVATVRDLFGASRKYALALMEYLDQKGVTRRIGDERVLR